MEKKELICIVCPIGCRIEIEAGKDLKISGNKCKRGYEYAFKECTMPMRILTATVAVNNGELPVVPVKTDGEVPKGEIMECMNAIRQIQVDAPVKIGDIICRDILGTGINVVATRSMGTLFC